MCGIVGIVTTPSASIQESEITDMSFRVRHRGRDASGVFISERRTMALGHTRLSIIDLSPEANQPFYSRDGRYAMVFNGEIYNFMELKKELQQKYQISFKTHSDTEVLLEAFGVWGMGMAEKLEGMFAIAIVDQKENKVFLFRDRIGKKPLYYFQSDSLFLFASEIKALLQHPDTRNHRQINKRAITEFFHLGYIPEPDTIYKHIYKFPAGHSGYIHEDLKLYLTAYWRVYDKLDSERITQPDEAGKKLKNLLNQAVRKRLISDVPLGSFLSGGTDSSLITAIASKLSSTPLKTFSIGFTENAFDESRYAKAVAAHLNTQHTEYILSEKDSIGILETYLKHFDEPFADTSAIPTMLVSRLAREEVKVVLTGDGGDELFLGYGAYTWARRLNSFWLKGVKRPMHFFLKATGKSRYNRIAHLLEEVSIGNVQSHIFSQEQYFFSQKEIASLLLKDNSAFEPFTYNELSGIHTHLYAEERQALFDLQFYLKDDLLVKVDRASMFYGLECRCPLLDHHVIEYAMSLHRSLKRKNGVSKWILKQLLSEYIPKELVDRPKWGFSVPLSKWLKTDLKYLVDELLSPNAVDEIGIVTNEYVQKLKSEFFGGQEYLYNRLWAVIVLHKWWKENQ